jgi:hypothetical protein
VQNQETLFGLEKDIDGDGRVGTTNLQAADGLGETMGKCFGTLLLKKLITTLK